MPPINHLNPPPNPFWDFVADMQEHPFFAAYAPHSGVNQQESGTTAAGASSATTTNNQQEQTSTEDPPEVDPSTLREDPDQNDRRRCRGRRRCGSSSDEEMERRREWHALRSGWGHHGRGGFGGPFGGAGFPFGGPHPWGVRAGHPHPPPPPPPPGFGPGPHGRGGHHHRGGPPHHFRGHPHHHGHHGPRGPSPPPPPPPPGPPGFNLHQFLNDLGSRIGMDLSGAAESLGLTSPNNNPDADFEPKADIFDRPTEYIVHLSLPGAKKSDVGVDWDGEHSSLRIAGVVHRPGVDEEMLSQLVVDGRKRETGVFEKSIRLGTRRDPASIDVVGISAKMTDGVLVITIPKTERQHQKRDVPISQSATPSPDRGLNEKHVVFDVDREMLDVVGEPDHEINLVDLTVDKPEPKGKEKEAEAERVSEKQQESRESSGTIEADNTAEEQLPAYNPGHSHAEIRDTEHDDWEHFGSDEEGEFVKINVD